MTNELDWKHIVLADNDEDDCFFFNEAVAQCMPAVQLTVETSISSFLQKISGYPVPVDAVFMEINTPELSGWDCLEAIPQGAATRPALIIFTTSDTFADIDKAYRLGANLYISKSDSIAALSRQIQTARQILVEHMPLQPPRNVFFVT